MAHEIWLTFADGTEHELREGFSIGRDEQNDLTLESKKVSREHAEIRLERGRWVIEDQGSFNGTYLNGVRLEQPRRLAPGDVVRVGETDLRYER